MIYKQLQKPDFRFIKVKRNDKEPSEKKWSTDVNYRFDSIELLQHIKRGGNLGLATGFGNILVIDFDNKAFQDKYKDKLPDTLMQKSALKGLLHYFYIVDKPFSSSIKDEHKETLVDFQGIGKQILIAPSKINGRSYNVFEDKPIATITSAELKAIFSEHFMEDKETKTDLKKPPLIDILNKYGVDTSKNPTQCLWHNSKGGKCFSYNENVWHCFNCEESGDVISFVMKHEKCDFKEACKILEIPIKERKKITKENYINLFNDEDPETEIELISKPESIDFVPLIKVLENDTKHLPLYSVLENELGFKGENYKTLTKFLYYRYCSLALDSIRIDINKTFSSDNHIHGLVFALPGKGKGVCKTYEKKLCKTISKSCYEISALSHREQLIGKRVKDREIRGILSADSVLYDECQKVINEETDQHGEAMRVVRQAMDIFLYNELSKKLINDELGQALSYCSPSKMLFFAHPNRLNPVFFESGTFRRFSLITNIELDNEISISDITKLKTDTISDDKIFSNLLNELKDNININNLTYTQNCLDILSDFYGLSLWYLLKHGNNALFRYGLITQYSLKLHFSKYINVLHLINNKDVTDIKLTINACFDALHMLLESVKTISNYGNLTISNEVWFGCSSEEKIALEYLYRKGALSRDSSTVSIKRFDTVLANLMGVVVKSSRSRRYKLQKMGYIDSSQVGKYDSKVWLLAIPNQITVKEDHYIPENLLKYFKGAQGVFSEKEPLDLSIIEEKYKQEIKGAKGAYVPPPINNIYTHQLLKYIYCNIYIKEYI